MKNEVKAHLESGQKVYGTFLWSASEAIVESLGYSGLEFIVIDSEHSPIDTEGAVRMIRTAKLRNLTPIVRVKEHSRTAVLKMLDAGAEGLVIPCLHSADEVRRIVEYGKYAPLGERGFAQGRQAGYGFEPWAADISAYFARSNAQTLLLPMCETAEFLQDLEEIVQIEGVDGIFVGPYDLSVALGKPGVFDTQEFQDTLRHIAQTCSAAGKYSFIFFRLAGSGSDA